MKRLMLVAALLATIVPGAAARVASAAPAQSFADGHGLHVLKVTQFDDRDYNVSVLSPYLGRPIDIRLLLPVGYATHPNVRYPVLYLFHGTSGVAAIHSEFRGTRTVADFAAMFPERFSTKANAVTPRR